MRSTFQPGISVRPVITVVVPPNRFNGEATVDVPNGGSKQAGLFTGRKLTARNQMQYLVREQIGEGGMAIVYKAVDLQTGNEVAVKQIKPGQSEERIVMEIETLRDVDKFNHPNIVKLFQTFQSNNQLYFVLELCAKGSL